MAPAGGPAHPQRRRRSIAMTDAELDQFLTAERTCRLATVGAAGPHITPLWFVWHECRLWFSSLVRSQRLTDLQRDPRIAAVVDAGHFYTELRGVELRGEALPVGEVPRTEAADAGLEEVEAAFATKYGGGEATHDGSHAWLRLEPAKIVSWDFRKL